MQYTRPLITMHDSTQYGVVLKTWHILEQDRRRTEEDKIMFRRETQCVQSTIEYDIALDFYDF